MSAHVLIEFINELRKRDNFYPFFATSLINSIFTRARMLDYNLKSHFCRKNVINLS